MNRESIIRKFWYESHVSVFLERFLLVVCAGLFLGFVISNQMHLDNFQRFALGMVLVGGAYLIASAVQKSKPLQSESVTLTQSQNQTLAQPQVPPTLPQNPTPMPPEAGTLRENPSAYIEQRSEGPNSPNIVGSGNTVNIASPPRTLTDQQVPELPVFLSPYKGQPVHVYAIFSDAETQNFSQYFVTAFKLAEWDIKEHVFMLGFGQPKNVGLWFCVRDQRNQTPGTIAFGDFMVKNLHLDVKGQQLSDAEEGHIYLYVGLRP